MSERTGTTNLETRNDMQSGNHFYIIMCNLKDGGCLVERIWKWEMICKKEERRIMHTRGDVIKTNEEIRQTSEQRRNNK